MPRIPYADPSTLPADLKEWHDKLPPDSHLFLMAAHASASAGLRELAANGAGAVIEFANVLQIDAVVQA